MDSSLSERRMSTTLRFADEVMLLCDMIYDLHDGLLLDGDDGDREKLDVLCSSYSVTSIYLHVFWSSLIYRAL